MSTNIFPYTASNSWISCLPMRKGRCPWRMKCTITVIWKQNIIIMYVNPLSIYLIMYSQGTVISHTSEYFQITISPKCNNPRVNLVTTQWWSEITHSFPTNRQSDVYNFDDHLPITRPEVLGENGSDGANLGSNMGTYIQTNTKS